jgi:hypothetical protein
MIDDITRRRPAGPEFVEQQWVSDAVRDLWTPRINAIKALWRELEWRSVATKFRSCGITTASPSQLAQLSELVAPAGLTAVPLVEIPKTDAYQSQLRPLEKGQPGMFLCVVAEPRTAAKFVEYWKTNTHTEIGRLLGYPLCCIAFFQRIWGQLAFLDTTWPMARNTQGAELIGQTLVVHGPWQANLLLRWLGVRSVPHLPCSFNCDETVRFANRYLEVTAPDEFPDARRFLEEMLSWPIEWTASQGVAEIHLPVMTIRASTDWTERSYGVQWSHAGQLG